MNQAFSLLRDHARARNLRLSDLAQAVIDRTRPSPVRLLPGPGRQASVCLLAGYDRAFADLDGGEALGPVQES
jgi:hypothetical protein